MLKYDVLVNFKEIFKFGGLRVELFLSYLEMSVDVL